MTATSAFRATIESTATLRSRSVLRKLWIMILTSLSCLCFAQGELPSQWFYSGVGQVNSLAISPDGKFLAVVGYGAIQIYTATTHSLVGCLPTRAMELNSAVFTADSKNLLVGGSTYQTNPPGIVEIWNVATGKLTGTIATTAEDVMAVALSPDGRTIVVAGADFNPFDGPPAGVLEFWSASTGKMLKRVATPAEFIRSIVFSADGSTLVLGGTAGNNAGILRTMDFAKQKVVNLFKTAASTVYSIAISHDGKTIVAGGNRFDNAAFSFVGVLETWGVSTGKLGKSIATQSTYVPTVAISPDGKSLIDGTWAGESYLGTVEVRDLSTGNLIKALDSGQDNGANAMVFSPDGKALYVAGGSLSTATNMGRMVIYCWSTKTLSLSKSFSSDLFSTYALAFSPDGHSLATIGLGADPSDLAMTPSVGIWDVSSGRVTKQFPSMTTGNLISLKYSPNGAMIADGGEGKTGGLIEIWDASTRKLISSPATSATGHVRGVAFSPDSKILAAGGYSYDFQLLKLTGGVLELWNPTTGALITSLGTGANTGVASVSFSPDGKRLAICGTAVSKIGNYSYGVLELWDVTTGTLLSSLPTGELSPTVVTFSPDGQTLAVGGAKFVTQGAYMACSVELWNVANGNLMVSLPVVDHDQTITDLAFTPDGKVLYATSYLELLAFSATNFEQANTFEITPGAISVSPNGSQLAYFNSFYELYVTANPYNAMLPITNLTISPATVTSGGSVKATIQFSRAAPTGGASVIVGSSNGSAIVPSTISVAAGAKSATFTIATTGVGSITSAVITAISGSSTKTATVAVYPAALASLSCVPNSVTGGSSSTGTVTLTGMAGSSGTIVALSTTSGSVTIPTSVTVPAGKTSTTFTISALTVSKKSSASITATLGNASKTATLTIQ